MTDLEIIKAITELREMTPQEMSNRFHEDVLDMLGYVGQDAEEAMDIQSQRQQTPTTWQRREMIRNETTYYPAEKIGEQEKCLN
ncbi:MAG: hypothetical protein FWE45_00800 [Firmicutes bacterium]|nr:hypothetical protein [Bacillota bacterium]